MRDTSRIFLAMFVAWIVLTPNANSAAVAQNTNNQTPSRSAKSNRIGSPNHSGQSSAEAKTGHPVGTESTPVPLSLPDSEKSRDSAKRSGPGPSIGTTLIALGLILVAFIVLARLWKTHGPAMSGSLPTEAIEILGQRAIDQRNVIQLVRCGSRILVLGSSPEGLRTLSEITDPVEVDLLAGACRADASRRSGSGPFLRLFDGYATRTSTPDGRHVSVPGSTKRSARTTPATSSAHMAERSIGEDSHD